MFSQSELSNIGILPGTLIYGCGLHKSNITNLPSNINPNLKINYRSGLTDTTYSTISNSLYPMTYSNSIAPTSPYYSCIPYTYNVDFGFTTQYANGINLNIQSSPGWMSFMANAPVVYNGGALEIHTVWNIDTNLYPILSTSEGTINNKSTTGSPINRLIMTIFYSCNTTTTT